MLALIEPKGGREHVHNPTPPALSLVLPDVVDPM